MVDLQALLGDRRPFVAGHRGLLGRHLVEQLEMQGCSPLVKPKAELNLEDAGAVRRFFEAARPGVVFLCAGLTGGIQENLRRPADFLHVNLAIQDAVFEAARKSGTRYLVFYGSSCVYPRDARQPIPESALHTGPLEPSSAAYASAKLAGLAACEAYTRQEEGPQCIALIPNTMYGPGDHFSETAGHVLGALVARFHRAKREALQEVVLWGSGKPIREFIHARDVARASLFALANAQRLENRPYNLGTGVETSILELAQMVSGVSGYEGCILWDASRPDGATRKCLDSRDFKELGWSPAIPLLDGIQETCHWFAERSQS